jgi:hypothetical protein
MCQMVYWYPCTIVCYKCHSYHNTLYNMLFLMNFT